MDKNMLWVKAFHTIFMVTWFAGLFYLPRLFVYHAMSEDAPSRERLKVMERKLYYGIMAPGAIITVGMGLWLWLGYREIFSGGWLHAKIVLVLLAIGYHHACRSLLRSFEQFSNRRSERWFRVFNESSVLLFIAIVVLVVVKPF